MTSCTGLAVELVEALPSGRSRISSTPRFVQEQPIFDLVCVTGALRSVSGVCRKGVSRVPSAVFEVFGLRCVSMQ